MDSGRTLELVRDMYPRAHYAAVYAKPMGRPMVNTYITEVSQDTWIFFPWDMALQYVKPYRGNDSCEGRAGQLELWARYWCAFLAPEACPRMSASCIAISARPSMRRRPPM